MGSLVELAFDQTFDIERADESFHGLSQCSSRTRVCDSRAGDQRSSPSANSVGIAKHYRSLEFGWESRLAISWLLFLFYIQITKDSYTC